MSRYEPNPQRGCGFKVENAFYLEGEIRPGGSLHSWVWCLGDGLEDVAPVAVPPRAIVGANPAASIVEGTLTENPYEPAEWNADLYERLLQSMPHQGVADHVGANNYSAWSFAQETSWHGASRRVPPAQAKALGLYIFENGPIPALYTHSRVPAFRNETERERAIVFTRDLYNTDFTDYWIREASWQNTGWGMYARKNQDRGEAHYLIPVLRMVDKLDCHWGSVSDLDVWQEAKAFFDSLRYVEQTIGLSWLTRVSYTLPTNEKERSELVKEIPGLFLIDLKEKA